MQAVAAHCRNGEALLGRNQYADAIAAFESGMALNPDDAACQRGIERTQV